MDTIARIASLQTTVVPPGSTVRTDSRDEAPLKPLAQYITCPLRHAQDNFTQSHSRGVWQQCRVHVLRTVSTAIVVQMRWITSGRRVEFVWHCHTMPTHIIHERSMHQQHGSSRA